MSDTKVACPKCGQTELIIKNGKNSEWIQKFKCKTCNANYLDNCTKDDNTEIVENELSDNPIQVAFRKNYRNEFSEPRYSKKYDFHFNSWQEYYSLRSKFRTENWMNKKTEDLSDNEQQNEQA